MSSLNKIVAGGFENLLVVADFDRTLTKAFVDGHVTALISTMVREKVFDDDYNQTAKKLYDYYRPIEIDESLPLEHRSQKMQEWWEKISQALITKKLSKEKIRFAMKKSHSILRDGVPDFLHKMHTNNVPIVILSANALGKESIQCFLDESGLNFPNIHIFCNEFIWNEDGIATDYVKPLVHVFNKDFTLIKKSPIYSQIEGRQNVIAIGDNLSDLDMVKNCDYNNLFKVGFLNENIENLRSVYQKNFDLVIENDGDFSAINTLIERLDRK